VTPGGEPRAASAGRLPAGAVAAIVVTWRRRAALETLLAALARQTRPVDHLIVVDNDADESIGALVARHPGPSTYIPSWRNLGSAGGFALGALSALARGASWVWFTDDDGRPASDGCLAELLSCATRRGLALVAPLVLSQEDPARLSFRMRRGLRWVDRPDELDAREFLPRHACLFNGALFSAEALDVLGMPDYRLFVRGDEVEVHRRALRSGLSFGTCLTAAMLHPSGAGESRPILGGRVYVHDPGDPGKRYYTFRNRGYLSTQPGRRLLGWLDVLSFGWYFLAVRHDLGGFREWARLTGLGRRERLLRRPGP
jgi:rhamnopyranosyl-N-acetylglucosaminyl-diphospho-decaprenol beta-1,3/1,4-galactofuranosyltransferase